MNFFPGYFVYFMALLIPAGTAQAGVPDALAGHPFSDPSSIADVDPG